MCTITTVADTGKNPILAWDCTNRFTTLLWVLLRLVIHIVATTNYWRFSLTKNTLTNERVSERLDGWREIFSAPGGTGLPVW